MSEEIGEAEPHPLTPSELPAFVWRPIETAPVGRPFLGINARWEITRAFRHSPSCRTDEILCWDKARPFKATHWMPLPAPPADEAQEAETGAERRAGKPIFAASHSLLNPNGETK